MYGPSFEKEQMFVSKEIYIVNVQCKVGLYSERSMFIPTPSIKIKLSVLNEKQHNTKETKTDSSMFLLCKVNTNVTIGFLVKFETILNYSVKASTSRSVGYFDGTKVDADGQSLDEENLEEISTKLLDEKMLKLDKLYKIEDFQSCK